MLSRLWVVGIEFDFCVVSSQGVVVNNYLIMKVCVVVFLGWYFFSVFLCWLYLFFKISIYCVLSKFSTFGF
mgnify:CR=1 FL=1